ncbi:hypothetical protein F4604DRAFT_1919485 [Suillus subluteus]|nr:hypothetical protein F4604DRAFT_1932995 [Suillus subluteus]KAG1884324.1 hypothetical protein F4604DRAFT_1919485 [Suillus subluteus]
MTQSGGHWHPNPQLMQQHSIPQVGVALPPIFPGPPPMPSGANAHPHCKAGFLQYNPAYNVNAGSGVSWAPGMGWAQNVPANFNPYKHGSLKMILVWRTWSLRDRDLESTRDVQGDAVPQTPWTWNSPSLLLTNGADNVTSRKAFNNRRSSQDSVRSNSTLSSYGLPQRGSQDSHNTTSTGTPV